MFRCFGVFRYFYVPDKYPPHPPWGMLMPHYYLKYFRGWAGGAKALCILRHQGVHLMFAYSWARPAILVAGKGKVGMFYFFCFITFIPVLFPVPLFHFYYLFSSFLWEMTQNDPQRLTCMSLNPNTVNQSHVFCVCAESCCEGAK